MLAQDYILKQVASSITYPESEMGKKYWQEINSSNTQSFTKIWITAKKAKVYEGNNTVVIIDSKLEALMDSDYLAAQNSHLKSQISNLKSAQNVETFKRLILPQIENDVNNGKNFANLRQIYNAVILGKWFKEKFKESFYRAYLNKDNVNGIDTADKQIKEQIYNMYVEAFTKGVYNYVKKDYNPAARKVTKRQYFSGGVVIDPKIEATNSDSDLPPALRRSRSVAVNATLTPNGILARSAAAVASLWRGKKQKEKTLPPQNNKVKTSIDQLRDELAGLESKLRVTSKTLPKPVAPASGGISYDMGATAWGEAIEAQVQAEAAYTLALAAWEKDSSNPEYSAIESKISAIKALLALDENADNKHIIAVALAWRNKYGSFLALNQLTAILEAHKMPGGWREYVEGEYIDPKQNITIITRSDGKKLVTTGTKEQNATKLKHAIDAGLTGEQAKWLADEGWMGKQALTAAALAGVIGLASSGISAEPIRPGELPPEMRSQQHVLHVNPESSPDGLMARYRGSLYSGSVRGEIIQQLGGNYASRKDVRDFFADVIAKDTDSYVIAQIDPVWFKDAMAEEILKNFSDYYQRRWELKNRDGNGYADFTDTVRMKILEIMSLHVQNRSVRDLMRKYVQHGDNDRNKGFILATLTESQYLFDADETRQYYDDFKKSKSFYQFKNLTLHADIATVKEVVDAIAQNEDLLDDYFSRSGNDTMRERIFSRARHPRTDVYLAIIKGDSNAVVAQGPKVILTVLSFLKMANNAEAYGEITPNLSFYEKDILVANKILAEIADPSFLPYFFALNDKGSFDRICARHGLSPKAEWAKLHVNAHKTAYTALATLLATAGLIGAKIRTWSKRQKEIEDFENDTAIRPYLKELDSFVQEYGLSAFVAIHAKARRSQVSTVDLFKALTQMQRIVNSVHDLNRISDYLIAIGATVSNIYIPGWTDDQTRQVTHDRIEGTITRYSSKSADRPVGADTLAIIANNVDSFATEAGLVAFAESTLNDVSMKHSRDVRDEHPDEFAGTEEQTIEKSFTMPKLKSHGYMANSALNRLTSKLIKNISNTVMRERLIREIIALDDGRCGEKIAQVIMRNGQENPRILNHAIELFVAIAKHNQRFAQTYLDTLNAEREKIAHDIERARSVRDRKSIELRDEPDQVYTGPARPNRNDAEACWEDNPHIQSLNAEIAELDEKINYYDALKSVIETIKSEKIPVTRSWDANLQQAWAAQGWNQLTQTQLDVLWHAHANIPFADVKAKLAYVKEHAPQITLEQRAWLIRNRWLGVSDDLDANGNPVGGLTWDNTKVEKYGNGNFYFENIPDIKSIESMGFVINAITPNTTVAQFLN